MKFKFTLFVFLVSGLSYLKGGNCKNGESVQKPQVNRFSLPYEYSWYPNCLYRDNYYYGKMKDEGVLHKDAKSREKQYVHSWRDFLPNEIRKLNFCNDDVFYLEGLKNRKSHGHGITCVAGGKDGFEREYVTGVAQSDFNELVFSEKHWHRVEVWLEAISEAFNNNPTEIFHKGNYQKIESFLIEVDKYTGIATLTFVLPITGGQKVMKKLDLNNPILSIYSDSIFEIWDCGADSVGVIENIKSESNGSIKISLSNWEETYDLFSFKDNRGLSSLFRDLNSAYKNYIFHKNGLSNFFDLFFFSPSEMKEQRRRSFYYSKSLYDNNFSGRGVISVYSEPFMVHSYGDFKNDSPYGMHHIRQQNGDIYFGEIKEGRTYSTFRPYKGYSLIYSNHFELEDLLLTHKNEIIKILSDRILKTSLTINNETFDGYFFVDLREKRLVYFSKLILPSKDGEFLVEDFVNNIVKIGDINKEGKFEEEVFTIDTKTNETNIFYANNGRDVTDRYIESKVNDKINIETQKFEKTITAFITETNKEIEKKETSQKKLSRIKDSVQISFQDYDCYLVTICENFWHPFAEDDNKISERERDNLYQRVRNCRDNGFENPYPALMGVDIWTVPRNATAEERESMDKSAALFQKKMSELRKHWRAKCAEILVVVKREGGDLNALVRYGEIESKQIVSKYQNEIIQLDRELKDIRNKLHAKEQARRKEFQQKLTQIKESERKRQQELLDRIEQERKQAYLRWKRNCLNSSDSTDCSCNPDAYVCSI